MPRELVRFLEFVEAPLSESEKDFEDDFIQKLQDSVKEVKESREMGARYMTFQELLKDEREIGRAEGIQVLVRILRKQQVNDEEIVRQLMEELSIGEKEAREYLAKDA